MDRISTSTALADATEKSYRLNASLYVYVLSTSVTLMGPPPVVIQISANCCVVQMKSSSAIEMMIGRSCGMVTLRNCWKPFAPSTVAASYRSRGMPCRPASRLIMKNGYPAQMLMNVTAPSAVVGDDSHWMSVFVMPKVVNR